MISYLYDKDKRYNAACCELDAFIGRYHERNLINELVEKINSNVFSNSYFLIEVDESIDKETLKQIEKLLEEKMLKA
jgi:hypothetical protein